MNNTILGQYDYDNFVLSSLEIADLETYSLTTLHEYTHMLLSMQSNVGLFMYCMKRIVPPTEKCEDYIRKTAITTFIEAHYLKVQEGMAVFSECMAMILDLSDQDCSIYINNLKFENRRYYKFIEPLFHIIRIMQAESERNLIMEAFFWVYQTALFAMNSNIYMNDAQKFKTKKEL